MNKLRSLLITEGMLSYCEYATRGDYSDAFIVLINVIIKVLLTTTEVRTYMGYYTVKLVRVTLSLHSITTATHMAARPPLNDGGGYSITCRFCCRHTEHQAERWCRFECTWTVLD